MRALKVNPLTEDRVAQAYPIIQMAVPALAFESWRRFALALIGGDETAGGIVTVSNEQNYIVGLGAYRLEQDLRDNRTLVADHFVAVDLIRREAVAQALAAELERLAQRNRCNAVHTCVSGVGVKLSTNWLVELMKARGHDVAQLLLRKSLANDA